MSFKRKFLLGPVFFGTALPCSGGYNLEMGEMPLHDAVGVNYKNGTTTENQGEGVKCILQGVYVGWLCVCVIWLDMTTPLWWREKVIVYYYIDFIVLYKCIIDPIVTNQGDDSCTGGIDPDTCPGGAGYISCSEGGRSQPRTSRSYISSLAASVTSYDNNTNIVYSAWCDYGHYCSNGICQICTDWYYFIDKYLQFILK